MFDQTIIEKILRTWKLDQNHQYREREKKPIPSFDDVKEILEQSFLASLKREEEKPISFCLAYLSKDNIEKEAQKNRKQLIIEFENEIPFTVEGISKIAPAFDPKISALIIDKSSHGKGSFSIWGAMFFGPSLNYFVQSPISFNECFCSRPDVFMITAKSAGTLIIFRGDSQIGSIFSGDFFEAVPTPFIERGLGKYLIDKIKDTPGFKDLGIQIWHIYSNALDYLFKQSSNRGHGSTIAFISNNLIEDSLLQVRAKYKFKNKLKIDDLMYQAIKNNNNPPMSKSYMQLLTERLDFLSQLSVIDGASILGFDFNVYSFGSTLEPRNKWQGKVIIGPDGFGGGGEIFDLSKYGTRHNSAINFVGSCNGNAIVFVISQDGPVRAFVKNDDTTILCWLDCSVSMFI